MRQDCAGVRLSEKEKRRELAGIRELGFLVNNLPRHILELTSVKENRRDLKRVVASKSILSILTSHWRTSLETEMCSISSSGDGASPLPVAVPSDLPSVCLFLALPLFLDGTLEELALFSAPCKNKVVKFIGW